MSARWPPLKQRVDVIGRSTFIISLLLVLLTPLTGWGGTEQAVASLLGGLERFAADTSSHALLLVCIAAATLVSEDLACIAAGLLAAGSIITPVEAVVASGLGIYLGDVLLYLTGHVFGAAALRLGPLKYMVSEQKVQQWRTLYQKRGLGLVFVCRFVPGTRTATFLGAGLLQVDMVKLLAVFGLAVIIWTPLLVLTAMAIGIQVVEYADVYTSWAPWIFLTLLGLLFFTTRVIPPLFTRRGRRLLVGRWRRLIHWEFWPYYVVNVVTFFYVLYTGLIRYRAPTLFTVTNPAIKPDSGFLGESKSAILAKLPQRYVGIWRLVRGSGDSDRKLQLLDGFMVEHGLDFPVVLKPDRGQRGQGVEICRDREQAARWLETARFDYMMMECLPGVEFGVFYYRLPDESKGRIFSINRKKLLSVTGDGERTLEELILDDERAVCMAPTFFKALKGELLDIVPAGQARQIGMVGTHSRGALFLDGSDLISPELLDAVERMVEGYEGFYFGRFDVMVPREEDLPLGRNLMVIELNGLTSEATHIYDPKNSLFYAWRILIEQWSIAFRIAEQNRSRGCRPMGLADFFRHWYRAGTGRLQAEPASLTD